MRLELIYNLAVKEGMKADPRGRKLVKKNKGRVNPYADTRILYGNKTAEIKTILAGIDIGGAELLLADNLRRSGKKIDLVLSHHPQGAALASIHKVMEVQIDILQSFGIKRQVAEELLNKRIKEVERRFSAINHNRAVDIARLLDIPFMCIHTPADNHVVEYLQSLIAGKNPRQVKDIMRLLKAIPEYRQAAAWGAGPKLILGKTDNPAGKTLVDMTGGTEGSKEVFARLSQAGVQTIIAMHLSEEHYRKIKPEHINVIIAGHISSDNLGINLLLDKLCNREKLKIVSCSGFRRIERKRGI
ncbi:MAG: NGG1p interacting factor NIF3 [Candidatus Omnitrophota bacterium]|nr:NGG1p interacting factor NIF3 [Candidatus Omnitrophota bacterium]